MFENINNILLYLVINTTVSSIIWLLTISNKESSLIKYILNFYIFNIYYLIRLNFIRESNLYVKIDSLNDDLIEKLEYKNLVFYTTYINKHHKYNKRLELRQNKVLNENLGLYNKDFMYENDIVYTNDLMLISPIIFKKYKENRLRIIKNDKVINKFNL